MSQNPSHPLPQRGSENWREEVRAPARLVILFTRNLSIMLESSVDIVRAMDTLSSQPESPNFSLVISTMSQELSNGASLSTCARQFPQIFSPLYCSMLEVGERTGQLTLVLAQMGQWLERDWKIRAKVKAALTYPSLVFVVAFVMMMVMFTTVVPQFLSTLDQVSGELPWITKLVMTFSQVARNPAAWVFGVTLFFGARLLLKESLSDPEQGAQVYRHILTLPGIGSVLRSASIARFASVLNLTITSGLDIAKSLELACASSGNPAIEYNAREILAAVREGESLSGCFKAHPELYSSTLYHITVAGEESASLSDSMDHVAQIHDNEVELAIHNLTSLLEPILLVMVAAIVGGILLSIFLPLYSNIGTIT